MCERKSWTKMQDKVLKLLRQQKGYKKWSEVAEIMRTQYGIQGRNGKQCRERYHNHLDQRISKQEWTNKQDEQLLILHSKYGNRWAMISQELKGRTDNCVKNRFYSRFRRSIRNINGLIKIYWKKQFKQLKPTLISKVIQIIEQYRTTEEESKREIFEVCESLKCRLMGYSGSTQQQLKYNQQRQNQLYQLIKEINTFNRKNKRKSKKKKKQSDNQEEHEEIWSEDKIKNKNQKVKKQSEGKITRRLSKNRRSEPVMIKQEILVKLENDNMSKPIISKNMEIDTQNLSSNKFSTDEGRTAQGSKIEIEIEEVTDRRKNETFETIQEKIEQGFDINQFYNLEQNEQPFFY